MCAQLNPRPVALVTNQARHISSGTQRRFHADEQAWQATVSGRLSTCGSHTLTLLRRYVSVNDWRARQKTAQAFREGTHYRRRPARDCPFRSLHIRTLRCSPPGRIEVVMAIENLFRYPALAVGLKPSASQGEARLRGL
jgi:hypothetical protein